MKITPYLMFDGNCREAMAFYQQCFGGELQMMRVSESPMASQMPPASQELILHANLVSGDLQIFASDMLTGERIAGNSAILCITGTEAEIRDRFEQLSAGGQIEHPIEKMFFGMVGNLVDRYGTRWMVESDTTE